MYARPPYGPPGPHLPPGPVQRTAPPRGGPLPVLVTIAGTWLCYGLCWAGAATGILWTETSTGNTVLLVGVVTCLAGMLAAIVGMILALARRSPGRAGTVVNVVSFVLFLLAVLILLVPMVLVTDVVWWRPVANPLTLGTVIAAAGTIWSIIAIVLSGRGR